VGWVSKVVTSAVGLPRGTDPAVASSLKKEIEALLTVVLGTHQWQVELLLRADEIAGALSRLSAPAARR